MVLRALEFFLTFKNPAAAHANSRRVLCSGGLWDLGSHAVVVLMQFSCYVVEMLGQFQRDLAGLPKMCAQKLWCLWHYCQHDVQQHPSVIKTKPVFLRFQISFFYEHALCKAFPFNSEVHACINTAAPNWPLAAACQKVPCNSVTAH